MFVGTWRGVRVDEARGWHDVRVTCRFGGLGFRHDVERHVCFRVSCSESRRRLATCRAGVRAAISCLLAFIHADPCRLRGPIGSRQLVTTRRHKIVMRGRDLYSRFRCARRAQRPCIHILDVIISEMRNTSSSVARACDGHYD